MFKNDLNLYAAEFDRHTGRQDGPQVVARLNAGLGRLGTLLYLGLHQDVEKFFGADSMRVPVSEIKTRRVVQTEIELYQIAESAAAAKQSGYWPAGNNEYVPWLARLRVGEFPLDLPHRQRIDAYLSKTSDARRLVFSDVLATVLPESNRAPLVLFLLFPLGVQIATALAFGDRPCAERLRASQIEHLPIISGCRQCHGRLLDNGETCRVCDNPLWKTEWLTSAE